MSAHPSDGRPKGMQSVTDRMLAAAALIAEGRTRAEVAKLYGVKRQTISEWCTRVREAKEDARNLERLGRSDTHG